MNNISELWFIFILKLSVQFSDLNLVAKTCTIRDLWNHTNLRKFQNQFATVLFSHDSMLISLSNCTINSSNN